MLAVAPGSSIGPYVARDELGRGGMGIVVAAWDPRLRREVALKIMHRGGTDPGHRARVLREAQALARLSHPHVVPVYDVGLHDDSLWVAMERVRGPTLAEWLLQPRAWTEIVDAFVQAARGLSAAHAAGLVHRDFKPSNAMIGSDDRVKVLDFGLAWAPGVDGARSGGSETIRGESPSTGRDPLAFTLTAPGAVVGTPPYMAPEQHERSEVDARADQYALCVALYEALAGVRPFTGDLLEMVAAKAKGAPPPPKHTQVPRRAWAVVARGLAREPTERWPDIDAFVDALEHASRRPPWVGAAFGLGGLALVVGALAARPVDAADDRCRALVDRALALRRGDRHAEIAAAFAASGREQAEATAAAVQEKIEVSAAAWADVAATACPAGDGATLDCVDGALDATDALLQVFATGGDEAILHAHRIAQGLPAPDACDAIEPTALAPIAADVRHELALARALGRSARRDEALDAAARALALAQELADERGTAHALYMRGAVRLDLGMLDEAEDDLGNALWAGIALGDDEIAAAAATNLVHACTARFDPACAQPWIRHAEASLLRLGDNGGKARSSLELALGDVAVKFGRLDEALRYYEKVLADTAVRGGETQLETAAVLDAIGVVHAEAGRHERAIEVFARSGEMFAALAGPLDPERAGSHERMAASYHALGRIAESREQIDEALRIIDAAHGRDHPRSVRLRGNLVLVMLDEGRADEALELAQWVVEAKRRVFGREDLQVAMALTNEGVAYAAAQRHAEALQSFRAGLELWELGLGPDNPNLWHALSGLARSALEVGDAPQARAATERALRLVTLQGGEASPDLLFTHAAAQWETGDREAAVTTMRRVAEMLPADAPHAPTRLHHDEARAWLDAHT